MSAQPVPIGGGPVMVDIPLAQEVKVDEWGRQRDLYVRTQPYYPHPEGVPVVLPAPPEERIKFCSGSCMRTLCLWGGVYVILIVFAGLLDLVRIRLFQLISTLLLSILPAATILTYLEQRFHKSVLRLQIMITFFTAVLFMVPIVLVEVIVGGLVDEWHAVSTKEGEPLLGVALAFHFINAYLIAGLFEETVKYCAVRRVVYKPYVVDARALVVYSCAAGAAFGTVEDLMYVRMYGAATGIARAFISVPLHCSTGLVMGLSLAEDRFLKSSKARWYKTLPLPILIHGTFDFVQFVFGSVLGLGLGIAILIATLLYIRKGLVNLLNLFPHETDVHAMLQSGHITAPSWLCCTPKLCPACCV